MNFGLTALIFLQLCSVGACLFVYSRFLSDKNGLIRDLARIDVVLAQTNATAANALKVSESLEVTHYKALQVRQLALETEANTTASKLMGFTESLAALNAKLASRERTDRKALKETLEDQAEAVETVKGKKGNQISEQQLADLFASGAAINLDAPPAPAQNVINGSFGKQAGRKQ
jgi:hypothetical protein